MGKIPYGFCLICGKEISQKCGDCGTRKPTSQYTEVQTQWTNNAKMNVAICVDCATKNAHTTAHGKAKITEAHHDHWDAEGRVHDKSIVIA